jgi:predicted Zn-dependent protease
MNAMDEQEKNLVMLLAWAYLQNARPQKAATLLAALDVMAPGQRQVLRTLALALVRSDEPQRALDTLERMAVTGPADAAYHLLRARALSACERRIEAGAAMAACLDARLSARRAEVMQ